MARMDPSTAADKWARRTSAASQDYAAGVANTQKDPTALAIAQLPVAAANYADAINSGRTAAGLRRAGKAGWQAGVASKGVTRFSSGATAAQPKYAAFAATFFPKAQAAIQNAIGNMPRGSFEQNMARAAAVGQALHALKGQGKQ